MWGVQKCNLFDLDFYIFLVTDLVAFYCCVIANSSLVIFVSPVQKFPRLLSASAPFLRLQITNCLVYSCLICIILIPSNISTHILRSASNDCSNVYGNFPRRMQIFDLYRITLRCVQMDIVMLIHALPLTLHLLTML